MKIDYSDLKDKNLTNLLNEHKIIEIKVNSFQLKLIKWAWKNYEKYWRAYSKNPSVFVHMTYGLKWVLIESFSTLFHRNLSKIFHLYVSQARNLKKVGMHEMDDETAYIKFEMKESGVS